MPAAKIILIVDNVRSAHNVGALLRTADGLGINDVLLCGITPYPVSKNDARLPHIASKVHRRIQKTSLGAEQSQAWKYVTDTVQAISDVRAKGYIVAALEQHKDSLSLTSYQASEKIAVVIGNEVNGVSKEVLRMCDATIEIPMLGKKESFNVVEAATMAMFYFRHLC